LPGGKQAALSRLEKQADVKASTLRGSIRALGGELQLVVLEGADVRIEELGEVERRGKRAT